MQNIVVLYTSCRAKSGNEKNITQPSRKGIKKFQKFFKNLLTKWYEGDIIDRLSRRARVRSKLDN